MTFKIFQSFKLLTTLLLLILPLSSQSEEAKAEIKLEESFISPKIVKRDNPDYPHSELKNGNAGMVDIQFMVGKEGQTFEPVIETSSRKSFETKALAALKDYQYEPATVNGQAIESVQRVRIVFLINQQDDQVSKPFYRKYKSAKKELSKEQPDINKIKKYIKSMENSSHLSAYSYRHLNTIKHSYAVKLNSKQSEIDAIYQLLLFEGRTTSKKEALKKDQRVLVRQLLVTRLIETSQYAAAIREFKKLKEIDPTAESKFKGAFKQIDKIFNSDKLIKTQLHINEQGYNLHELFKSTFGFFNGDNVSQIKLRCEKKFKILDYKPDSEYKIPKSWGSCYLQTIGVAGSTVDLYQL